VGALTLAWTLVPARNLGFLAVAAVLAAILVIAFVSRARVFCQYLKSMTGIALSPRMVRKAFRANGREGVRELFLDLIIREDLKAGPLEIPSGAHRSEERSPRG
jgi:hypothetical protein